MRLSRDELVERFRQLAEMLRKLDSDDDLLDLLARLQSGALCAWDTQQGRPASTQRSPVEQEGAQSEGFIRVTATTRWK